MNDYFTFFYVKHFELPMCMKCAIQINLPCLALPWMIVFAFTFDQGLTQTEIALCLSVIDDLHISVRHLRRRLSGLQLYIRQYSDPERVVTCSHV